MVEMEQKTWDTAVGKAFQLGRSVLYVERADRGRVTLRILKPVELRLNVKNFEKYLKTVSESENIPVE